MVMHVLPDLTDATPNTSMDLSTDKATDKSTNGAPTDHASVDADLRFLMDHYAALLRGRPAGMGTAMARAAAVLNPPSPIDLLSLTAKATGQWLGNIPLLLPITSHRFPSLPYCS